jgi:hypothetical protein
MLKHCTTCIHALLLQRVSELTMLCLRLSKVLVDGGYHTLVPGDIGWIAHQSRREHCARFLWSHPNLTSNFKLARMRHPAVTRPMSAVVINGDNPFLQFLSSYFSKTFSIPASAHHRPHPRRWLIVTNGSVRSQYGSFMTGVEQEGADLHWRLSRR